MAKLKRSVLVAVMEPEKRLVGIPVTGDLAAAISEHEKHSAPEGVDGLTFPGAMDRTNWGDR